MMYVQSSFCYFNSLLFPGVFKHRSPTFDSRSKRKEAAQRGRLLWSPTDIWQTAWGLQGTGCILCAPVPCWEQPAHPQMCCPPLGQPRNPLSGRTEPGKRRDSHLRGVASIHTEASTNYWTPWAKEWWLRLQPQHRETQTCLQVWISPWLRKFLFLSKHCK